MDNSHWQQMLRRVPIEYSDRHEGGQELPTHDGNLKFLLDCKDVLDIGCGVGNAIVELKKSVPRVVGLTVSRVEAAEAQKRGHEVHVGDMHQLSFPGDHFDGVLMWDVLEHALAPAVVLWEVHRVLKENGRLLVYLPPQLWIEHPVHTWVPTQRQAKHLFDICGFTVFDMIDMQDEAAIYGLVRKEAHWKAFESGWRQSDEAENPNEGASK